MGMFPDKTTDGVGMIACGIKRLIDKALLASLEGPWTGYLLAVAGAACFCTLLCFVE